MTWLDSFMEVMSGQWIWLPVVLYFLLRAYRTFGKQITIIFVLFLLMTLFSADVTSSYIFKNVFNRLRPCRDDILKDLIYQFGQRCGGKFGFISSHASNSVALVAFGIWTLNLRKQYWLLALPLMVGYSRIYLGVHFPADVMIGFLVGLGFARVYAWFFSQLKVRVA